LLGDWMATERILGLNCSEAEKHAKTEPR